MNNIAIKVVKYADFKDQIMNIRKVVFIEEQNVPEELEIDGVDPESIHVLAYDGDEAVATGRMLLDGHIGRIAVIKEYRSPGIGVLIVNKLLDIAKNLNLDEVYLSSQYHARDFYQKLGFIAEGEIYLDAGIEHITMKKKNN